MYPTYKGRMPFEMWCIDLVTIRSRAGTPSTLIVAVCAFSKWVEAGPLEDKRSATVTRWVHSELVCRYGTPALIRTDRGSEFKGAFQAYAWRMGIR